MHLTLIHGDGLGRYVALNASNDAVVDAGNGLEAIGLTAYSASWRHSWSPKWRSSLIWSQLLVDNDVNLTGSAVAESTQNVAVNLIRQVAANIWSVWNTAMPTRPWNPARTATWTACSSVPNTISDYRRS